MKTAARIRRLALPILIMGSALWIGQQGRLAFGQGQANLAKEVKAEKLKQRDQLIPKIRELQRQGKLDDAAQSIEEMLTLEKVIFGQIHEEIAQSLDWLGNIHVARADYPAARAARTDALNIYRQLFPETAWKTVNARLALADVERFVKFSPQDQAALKMVEALRQRSFSAYDKQKYAESEALDRQILAIHQKLFGVHRETAATHVLVADDLVRQLKSAEAEAEERKALDIRLKLLGDEHPETAASYHALAFYLAGQKKYVEAEKAQRLAWMIRKETLGEKHRATIQSGHALANDLTQLGRFEEAAKIEEIVGKTAATVPASQAPGILLSKRFKGYLDRQPPPTDPSFGDLEKRLRTLGEMLWETDAPKELNTLKEKLLREADVLHDLAYQLRGQGNYSAGNRLERVAFALLRDLLGADLRTVQSGHLLAWGLYRDAHFKEAEAFDRQTLVFAHAALGPKHALSLLVLRNLSYDLREQGRYAEAEKTDRQSLALEREVHGEFHESTASMYNNLGFDLSQQGRHVEAEPMYRKALTINFKLFGENHLETLTSMANLAGTIKRCGDVPEALKIYRRIQTIFLKDLDLNSATDSQKLAFSRYCNLIAGILMKEDKLDEAEKLVKDSLRNVESLSALFPGVAEVQNLLAETQQHLAEFYRRLGQFDKAFAAERTALLINEKIYGADHLITLMNRADLAFEYLVRGQYTEGERLVETTVRRMELTLGPNHPSTLYTMIVWVYYLWSQDKMEAAENVVRKAAAGYEKARMNYGSIGLNRSAFQFSTTPMTFQAALSARAGKSELAWNQFEKNLARGLLDDISSRDSLPLNVAERLREQTLQGDIAALEKKIDTLLGSKKGNPEQVAELRIERNERVLQLGQFQTDLMKAYGPSAGQVFDLRRIQAQLPANAALLGWLDIDGIHHAKMARGDHWGVVVRRQGEPVWVNLDAGDQDNWQEKQHALLRQVQKVLLDPSSEPEQDLQALYRQRLRPLEKYLQGVKQLIILPSSVMAGIPVEALSDKYRVSYVPSGTLYALLREKNVNKPERGSGLLALGDPLFSSDQGQPVLDKKSEAARTLLRGKTPRALPGTRAEVESIARLFSNRQAPVVKLLGADATENRLDSLVANKELFRVRFVHLATHGYPDPVGGMNSYLALTPENLKVAGISRLSAGHIRRTWQLQADLVTLSACQTALGEERGGEGYVGFAQALLFAGARSLVLSQWPVNDSSTTLLMHRFYENLLGSRPDLAAPLAKVDALAEAQIWLKTLSRQEATRHFAALNVPLDEAWLQRQNRQDHPFQHPYYWAAFILVGDPGSK